MTRLNLDDIAQLLVFALEPLSLLKPFQNPVGERAPRAFAQIPLRIHLRFRLRLCRLVRRFGGVVIRLLPFDLEFLVNHRKHHRINNRLAELLDEIQHQRRLARAIDMQKTCKRFQSSQRERAPHLGIKHPVAVVEQRVHVVRRALVFSGRESSGGQQPTHALPVERPRPTLKVEQRGSEGVNRRYAVTLNFLAAADQRNRGKDAPPTGEHGYPPSTPQSW